MKKTATSASVQPVGAVRRRSAQELDSIVLRRAAAAAAATTLEHAETGVAGNKLGARPRDARAAATAAMTATNAATTMRATAQSASAAASRCLRS